MGDSEHCEITIEPSSRDEEEDHELAEMRRRLREQRRVEEQTDGTRKVCIHRVPTSLTGICPDAIEPEMVSVGPYHRGEEKLLKFESYKLRFLASLLRLGPADRLGQYYKAMKELEEGTRNCYPEWISMSSSDFVHMMVLDGCFIIELFRQMNAPDEFNDILNRLEVIPVVTRDLLKLQNQLPFFVLQKLFEISYLGIEQPLSILALQFFNHSLPRPSEVLKRTIKIVEAERELREVIREIREVNRELQAERELGETERELGAAERQLRVQREQRMETVQRVLWELGRLGEAKHLLHLFHLSFVPSRAKQQYSKSARALAVLRKVARLPAIAPPYFSRFLSSSRTPNDDDRDSDPKYRPSSESIQCTTQLRPSGVKFKPRRDAESFLDVDFHNGVLQIPPITINDLAIVVFINCLALERCHEKVRKHFTAYIAFMSSLINSTRDVTLLCADGIITGFSLNDQYVAEMFTKLGEKVVFDIRHCYLSEQFRDVEAYYSSHWAAFMRTYFSRPWSFISVLTASILLLLTGVQTAMSILSHLQPK